MQIQTVYTIGNSNMNEDAIVVNRSEDIYAAIDGATGLGGLSGSLASGLIKESLEKTSSLQLLDRVLEGNHYLRLAVEKEASLSLNQIPKYKRSSCGLAAIKIHRNHEGKTVSLEYVSAGDCMLFLQFTDSTIRQITFDHIDRLDNAAISLMQSEWDKDLEIVPSIDSIPTEELKEKHQQFRENVQDLLQANRNKLNTYEGYGIIDGDRAAESFLEHGKIPLICVQKILLLSDGLKLHSHRETKTQETWLSSAQIAFDSGLNELEKYIVKLEESDPGCVKYPRLKHHDDKTGILIEL